MIDKKKNEDSKSRSICSIVFKRHNFRQCVLSVEERLGYRHHLYSIKYDRN